VTRPIVCGENPLGVASAVGCGKPIESDAEVYRCTDCTTPFHRVCAIQHFAAADAAPVEVDWRASCIRAEERADKLLGLARRLAAALRTRGRVDEFCGCLSCSALRAFGRFLASDEASGDRRGVVRASAGCG